MQSRFNRTAPFLLLCLALAVCVVPRDSNAQVLYGTVLGTIIGPDGVSVPNSTITAANSANGFTRDQSSDDRGEYAFRDLPPGTYQLRVSAKGLATVRQSSVIVTINTVTRADFTLPVGAVAETIDVSANSAVLQTDSGDLHSELTAKQIQDLPISGYRNYQTLINLVPGATPARYQNSVMDTPSRSLTTNVNGTSRNTIATAVDGASIQQIYLPHHTLYNPPVDAIESVNIATNSFAAEQGLAGGAVVTVITKSGSNAFHGVLFEDHTNSSFAARNFFYLGKSVPENILNQFGATLGGPIKKDKLFFFSSYEGLIQRQNYSTILSVPTAAQRAGNFTGLSTIYDPATGNADGSGRSAFLNNQIPANRISPAAQKLLALVPLPNLPGTANNDFVSANYGLNRHSLDEKVTWQIDSGSSLFAKFSHLNADVTALSSLGAGGGTGLSPGGSNAGSGFSRTKVTVFGVGYNRILKPNLLLDANFGFGRNDLNWHENDYGKNLGTDLLGIPGTNGPDPRQSGLPSFAVSGFETFGNPDAYTPEIKHDNVFTYAANLGWTHGTHTVRFGVQALNNRLNEFQPQRGFGPRGGFTFSGGSTTLKGGAASTSANAIADLLLGNAASLGKSYQALDPITVNEWQEGIYAQDQWRVTPRMTFSYGLRWEYYPIIGRDTRGLERYNFSTNQVLLGGVGNIPAGAGTTANPHQFAPRAGLAFQLNAKTVLRGGYGISIDPYPFSRALRDPYPVTIAQTINSSSSYLPAGTLAAGIPAVAPVTLGNGSIPLPLDAYTKTLPAGQFTRGYVESFNLTFERELPISLTLSSGFVGSRSIHQTAYLEANAGEIPGAGATGQPLFIKFGRNSQTQLIKPYNTANYNALQLNLKRRFSKGILLTASYTYSKSEDFSSDSDSVPLFNAVAYQARNRAVSDFDRTHVFQSGFVVELPLGKGRRYLNRSGAMDYLLGGWQINGVFAKYSGLPFTPLASGTSLNAPFNTQVADQVKTPVKTLGRVGSGGTWFDTTAYGPVTQARFGTAGRNSLRGPGATNLDLGIEKQFVLTERFRFELRGEGFNISNTPPFANPGSNVSNGSFGKISSTFGGAADSRVLHISAKLAF